MSTLLEDKRKSLAGLIRVTAKRIGSALMRESHLRITKKK